LDQKSLAVSLVLLPHPPATRPRRFALVAVDLTTAPGLVLFLEVVAGWWR
jgi:hypothetical protein